MTETPSFNTEQEAFWHGDFGDAYTDRNDGDSIRRTNLMLWGGGILNRTGLVKSCFEIGCNKGPNHDAIKILLPSCPTAGLEINARAAAEC
jgi:hypothetical protein